MALRQLLRALPARVSLRRLASALVIAFALGCGEDAAPADAALSPEAAPGAPSGIEECDAFTASACACADTLAAAKDACELARKSTAGWQAASGEAQRDA